MIVLQSRKTLKCIMPSPVFDKSGKITQKTRQKLAVNFTTPRVKDWRKCVYNKIT